MSAEQKAREAPTRSDESARSAGHRSHPTDRAGAHVPITDEVIRYVQRYQGTCRDCADEAGYCPRNGIACGESEKAIRFVLGAINYGVSHGYLSLTQAAQPAEADGWVPIADAKSRHRYLGAFRSPLGGDWMHTGLGSVRNGVFRDGFGEWPAVDRVLAVPPCDAALKENRRG